MLSYSYAVGGSYAGLSTQVSSQTGGTTVGGPIEYTVATILAGNNSGSFTAGATASVSMTWRNRAVAETPSSPAGNAPLISDVVDLYGMASAATGSPAEGAVQTDPFVLQLAFDPTTLGSNEAAKVAAGNVYLAWLNPNGGGTGVSQWQHANTGDIGGTFTMAACANLRRFVRRLSQQPQRQFQLSVAGEREPRFTLDLGDGRHPEQCSIGRGTWRLGRRCDGPKCLGGRESQQRIRGCARTPDIASGHTRHCYAGILEADQSIAR